MSKILVVDDEFSVRELVSTSIKQFAGCEVDVAQDGFEAVKKVMIVDYDLIVIDIKMPKMNGIDAIKAIKIIRKDVPIIIMTGYASEEEKAEGLKAGAVELITKPFSVKKLIERITYFTSEYKPVEVDELSILKQSAVDDNRVIVIGSSMDGPQVLKTLFKSMKKDNYPPVIVVQHMPSGFIATLCDALSESTGKSVSEAQDGDKLLPNRIYFASSPDHILLKNGKTYLESPHGDQNFTPSISKTIISAVEQYNKNCLVLVLRGLSAHIDSQEGMTFAKQHNASVYALEDNCKMLDKFAREGLLDKIVTLDALVEIIDNF